MMIASSTSPNTPWLVRGVFVIAVLGLLASACGEEDPKKGLHDDYSGGSGGDGTGAGGLGGTTQVVECTDGDIRDCKIELGEYNGVVTCFVGVEECVDGAWGPCGPDGTGGSNGT